MGRGRGDTGNHEDLELHEPRGAAIPVPERVDPRKVHVRDDRLQNRVDELEAGLRREISALEPGAEPLEQVSAVFSRSAKVAAHGDRMAADLSRNNVFLDLQAFEHLAVEGADSVGCERNGTFGSCPGELVAGADDVVDFLHQVLLRLRQLQLALEVGENLLLGECVAFDRRRGECTFR